MFAGNGTVRIVPNGAHPRSLGGREAPGRGALRAAA